MRPKHLVSLRNRLLFGAFAVSAASLHCDSPKPDPPEIETRCLPPKPDGSCPTDEEALDAFIDQAPEDECPFAIDEPGATMVDGQCCYSVQLDCSTLVVGCNISGRPLIVEGRPLEGRIQSVVGWQADRLGAPAQEGLSNEERRLLAEHWARIGAAEYVSIAGFHRFAMGLLACGAPADLVLLAGQAAADEVAHAQMAFALASAFAGAPVGPGPLALPGSVPVPSTIAELACATAEEGCTVETFSACLLAEMSDRATDPAVRRAILRMRRDEDRHAELAWRALAWALAADPSSGARVDEALSAAISKLSVQGFSRSAGLSGYGLLSRGQAEGCLRAAIQTVIEPCRQAAKASIC